MWILDPISMSTGGEAGIAPGPDYCPLPLALSDSLLRFDVSSPEDPFGGGTGHGAMISDVFYPEPPRKNHAKMALLAIIAIETTDD